MTSATSTVAPVHARNMYQRENQRKKERGREEEEEKE